jgi:hypothetical protein
MGRLLAPAPAGARSPERRPVENNAHDVRDSEKLLGLRHNADDEVVGDRSLAGATRTEALKLLVHLVGDLHMPLHAYAPLNHPKGT